MDFLSAQSWALWILTALAAYLGAYAAEKGKRRAQSEDSAQIRAELARNTQAVKEIEAKISGDLWLRQTEWNQKRDLYVRLFEQIDALWDLHIKHRVLMKKSGTDSILEDAVKFDEIAATQREAEHKLIGLATLSIIFLNQAAQQALRKYEEERDQWAQGMYREPVMNLLDALKRSLIEAARGDLGLGMLQVHQRG